MSRRRRVFVEGIGVSPGVAIGSVYLVDRRRVRYPKHHIDDTAIDSEIERLEDAASKASEAIEALLEHAQEAERDEPSTILNAHLLMMKDPLLLDSARAQIRDERKCAEWAIKTAVRSIRKHFDQLGHAYFRERRSDVDFVGERILSALTKQPPKSPLPLTEDAVVVAHDISPADVISLLKGKVKAIVTEAGGKTSHTAILARALEIPAVVGCADVLELTGRGDDVVVDGTSGQVVLHPSKTMLSRYRGIAKKSALLEEELLGQAELEAVTSDGHAVQLLGNIDLQEDVPQVLAHGATGVGLYRTEFLFMGPRGLPSVEEHVRAYSYVLGAMGPHRQVTLRTFDLGSDKLAPLLKTPREDNPALGLRACRFGLAHSELFRAQLRGMILACSHGQGAIMFPMISSVEEFRQVKAVLTEEMDLLEREGVHINREFPVGVMIELPSAVWDAPALAEEADFFSVGTNDLIQYSQAIDRGNEQVAYLYQPLAPSLLRALKHVVTAAHDAGIKAGMCGEMAADPMHTAICAALGFDSLSMPVSAVPRVKWALRRLSKAESDELLERCLKLKTPSEVEEAVHRAMHARIPELFAPFE